MVTYYEKAQIGIIEFNDPDSKANLLSDRNIRALDGIIEDIQKKAHSINGLFFVSRKEDIFIAGADIKELSEIETKEEALEKCRKAHGLFNKIEDLNIPS